MEHNMTVNGLENNNYKHETSSWAYPYFQKIDTLYQINEKKKKKENFSFDHTFSKLCV